MERLLLFITRERFDCGTWRAEGQPRRKTITVSNSILTAGAGWLPTQKGTFLSYFTRTAGTRFGFGSSTRGKKSVVFQLGFWNCQEFFRAASSGARKMDLSFGICPTLWGVVGSHYRLKTNGLG